MSKLEPKTLNALRLDRREGMTYKQIADKHGIPISTVYNRTQDVETPQRVPKPPSDRDEQIRADHAAGATLRHIADKHGVTFQRVHQIVNPEYRQGGK